MSSHTQPQKVQTANFVTLDGGFSVLTFELALALTSDIESL